MFVDPLRLLYDTAPSVFKAILMFRTHQLITALSGGVFTAALNGYCRGGIIHF